MTVFIDAGMGAAGDMLTAALIEALGNKEELVKELNSLGIPGVTYKLERSEKCGIAGSHMEVICNGEEEGLEGEVIHHHHHHDHEEDHCCGHHHHEEGHECCHGHHHDEEHSHGEEHCCCGHHHEEDHECCHGHEHSHEGHHHTTLHDIEHIVWDHIQVEPSVKRDIMAVYRMIADAESHAHGKPVEEIHFHEVGTMDAVADVTAVCYLFSKFNADKVVVTPIHVGAGTVKCAHGIMPVPAPATAYILMGCPTYSSDIMGELCTPTGAALLKYFATEFGQMPIMKVSAFGYGMGKKDFIRANAVRVMVGEEKKKRDVIIELECNVDDMTAEELGFAMERLLEEGALEVFATPVIMKKSRPGYILTVLTRETRKEAMAALIFSLTTTIGIRETEHGRYVLERKVESVDTPYGPIRRKVSYGYGITREKYEYDDVATIAREKNLSIKDIRDSL